MVRGLQTGFGESIAWEYPALNQLGVQLARLDCKGLDASFTATLSNEAAIAGITPLVIVSRVDQLKWLPLGTNVELLNEPDINGPDPTAYQEMVGSFSEECDNLGLHLWAGSISNLNKRGLTYLRNARVSEWPMNVKVSIHRYPNGETPMVPHDGFASREAEVAALLVIIGTRQWGCSEFGYTTGNRATWWQRLFGIKRQWTDAQVRTFVAWEWDFWSRMSAAGAVLYQLNDGPNSAPINRMGIRRLDGTWKPVASTFRG